MNAGEGVGATPIPTLYFLDASGWRSKDVMWVGEKEASCKKWGALSLTKSPGQQHAEGDGNAEGDPDVPVWQPDGEEGGELGLGSRALPNENGG